MRQSLALALRAIGGCNVLGSKGGWPSIRGKALSRTKYSCRCRSIAMLTMLLRRRPTEEVKFVYKSSCGGTHVPPAIDSIHIRRTMIFLYEHPTMLGGRAPNQSDGLACADQGHPRAALHANDLRIRCAAPQHPVESYSQLARHRHSGHVLRLLVAEGVNNTCETQGHSGPLSVKLAPAACAENHCPAC